MPSQEPNYYQILNINNSCSVEEVKKSYRLLALRYHPDITGNNELKLEQFRLIKEAYNILSNPEKRKAYDNRNFFLGKSSKDISLESIEAEIGKLQSYLTNTQVTKLNYDNIHFELERILNSKAVDYLINSMDKAKVDQLVINLNRVASCLPYKLMQYQQAKFIGLTNNASIIEQLEQSLQKRKNLMVWGWLKFVIVVILAIAICIAIAFSI
jgi:molecular chaperone DnaJ